MKRGKWNGIPLIAFLTVFLLYTTAVDQYAWNAKNAGNRIAGLQADLLADNAHNGNPDSDWDGSGWNWIVDVNQNEYDSTEGPSSWENLYGITSCGPLWYYWRGPKSARMLLTCLDAYHGMVPRPEVDSGPDIFFLVLLSVVTGDSTYAGVAKERYDAKIDEYGGADSLAIYIMESRHSQGWDGLIYWDIGFWLWGSFYIHKYGFTPPGGSNYRSQAIEMLDVIESDVMGSPGYFDITDQAEEATLSDCRGRCGVMPCSRPILWPRDGCSISCFRCRIPMDRSVTTQIILTAIISVPRTRFTHYG